MLRVCPSPSAPQAPKIRKSVKFTCLGPSWRPGAALNAPSMHRHLRPPLGPFPPRGASATWPCRPAPRPCAHSRTRALCRVGWLAAAMAMLMRRVCLGLARPALGPAKREKKWHELARSLRCGVVLCGTPPINAWFFARAVWQVLRFCSFFRSWPSTSIGTTGTTDKARRS